MDGQSISIYGLVFVILARTIFELVRDRLKGKNESIEIECPFEVSGTIKEIATQGERLSDIKGIMLKLDDTLNETRLTLVEVHTYLKRKNGD